MLINKTGKGWAHRSGPECVPCLPPGFTPSGAELVIHRRKSRCCSILQSWDCWAEWCCRWRQPLRTPGDVASLYFPALSGGSAGQMVGISRIDATSCEAGRMLCVFMHVMW